MFERIVEIITFVLSELKQNKQINEIDISELTDLGYTREEISTAFSWLVDRIDFMEKLIPDPKTNTSQSFRILLPSEKELFSDEALSELIHLNTLGVINNEIMEALIDRAIFLGINEIDIHQLRNFVAYFIFQAQPPSQYGSRVMLQGNDTIH